MRSLSNDGILAARTAAAIWEGFVLLTFLQLKRCAGASRPPIFSLIILQIWLFPAFRIYDNGMPVLTVLSIARLLKKPNSLRSLTAGLEIGFAALVGRNHGVYAGAALALSLATLPRGRRASSALFVAMGTIIGYSPVLVMMLVDRRFRNAFVSSLQENVSRKQTNIFLPRRDAWHVWRSTTSVAKRAESLLYTVMPIAYCAAVVKLLWRYSHGRRVDPVDAAAVCVGCVYFHYVYSRADLAHLASSIFPLLWLSGTGGRLTNLSFAISTGILSTQMTPLFVRANSKEPYARRHFGNDELEIPVSEFEFYEHLTSYLAEAGASDAKMFIAPYLTALYPALSKATEVYDLSLTLNASERHQKSLIAEFEGNGVTHVLLQDVALDANEEHRFQNSHPLFWRHIMERFERFPTPKLPGEYLLLRRAINREPVAPDRIVFADPSAGEVVQSGFTGEAFDAHVWASPCTWIQLRVPEDASCLVIRGRRISLGAEKEEQILQACVDDTPLQSVRLEPGDFSVSIPLASDVSKGHLAMIRLTFSHSFVPAELGINGDGRTLAAAIAEVSLC